MIRKFLFLSVVMCMLSAFAIADDDFVITRDKVAESGRYRALKHTTLLAANTDIDTSLDVPINIYRIFVTGTAATSALSIYDGALAGATTAACVFEIFEATDGAGHYIDFGDDPIRLTTAFSVVMYDANAVIHYRDQD